MVLAISNLNVQKQKKREESDVKINELYLFRLFFGLFCVFFFLLFLSWSELKCVKPSKANTHFAFTCTPDIIHIQNITYITEGINKICTG